jgi:hypothetical protein
MEEWQKTLVSAGFGFAAGLLGEPLKSALSHWQKKRRMRCAIYRELAANFARLEEFTTQYEAKRQVGVTA